MSEKMNLRRDIPQEQTWNLKDLFPDEKAYEQAVQAAETKASDLVARFQGRIQTQTNPTELLQIMREFETFHVDLERLGTYAYLDFAVDMTDAQRVGRMQKAEALLAQVASQLSFYDSELMDVKDEVLAATAGENAAYESYINDLRRRKAHKLEPETEKVLAALSPALDLPQTIYEQAKHADMDFGKFSAGGKSYPLSFVLFENEYNLDRDPEIRRNAFQAFSQTLKKYENTVAAAYNGEVQKQKTISRLRGFDSVLDYLLDEQKVKRELYDRQIDGIMEHLAPHMRKYARLLQKEHGLDKMTFADLKIALDPTFDPKVSVEESKSYISSGLSVLGSQYHDLVMRSYDERWVDFAQNKGKSTGGFCSSPYGGHGYILLSWTGRLSEVFTLAHELGHAAHFMLAQEKQTYFGCDTSLYFVEAPSTCNEMFLSQALYRQKEDPRFKRWVLSSMIQNTYYHNFVTHLLEAAYQREVYRRVDAGQFLQAAELSAIKRDMLERFWGDAVEISEGAELTWMRQPHYYMGLYPYTYSAGLTIATAASQRILKEGKPAVDDWLKALAAGGTVTPVEFAQTAGVDITTDQPLKETIAYIGQLIDEIEKLGHA